MAFGEYLLCIRGYEKTPRSSLDCLSTWWSVFQAVHGREHITNLYYNFVGCFKFVDEILFKFFIFTRAVVVAKRGAGRLTLAWEVQWQPEWLSDPKRDRTAVGRRPLPAYPDFIPLNKNLPFSSKNSFGGFCFFCFFFGKLCFRFFAHARHLQ